MGQYKQQLRRVEYRCEPADVPYGSLVRSSDLYRVRLRNGKGWSIVSDAGIRHCDGWNWTDRDHSDLTVLVVGIPHKTCIDVAAMSSAEAVKWLTFVESA